MVPTDPAVELSSLSAEEQQAVEVLKAQFEDAEDVDGYLDTDETYIRYLRARDWSVNAAAKMLQGTLAWRKSYVPTLVTCKYCLNRPGYHSWRHVGFDKAGRAVTYSCIAQGKTANLVPDDCVMHATNLLENILPLSRERGASTYVWILDMTGLTMGACNPRLAAATNRIMSKHYPERMGYSLIIAAPWLFNATWTALKTFLDPVTASKIKFVKASEVSTVFDDLFPKELSDWLQEEMRRNKAITTEQLRFWEAPSDPSDHDPRGCPSFVKECIEPVLEDARRLPPVGSATHSGTFRLENGGPLQPEDELFHVQETTRRLAGQPREETGLPHFKSRRGLTHPNMLFPPSAEDLAKVPKLALSRDVRVISPTPAKKATAVSVSVEHAKEDTSRKQQSPATEHTSSGPDVAASSSAASATDGSVNLFASSEQLKTTHV